MDVTLNKPQTMPGVTPREVSATSVNKEYLPGNLGIKYTYRTEVYSGDKLVGVNETVKIVDTNKEPLQDEVATLKAELQKLKAELQKLKTELQGLPLMLNELYQLKGKVTEHSDVLLQLVMVNAEQYKTNADLLRVLGSKT